MLDSQPIVPINLRQRVYVAEVVDFGSSLKSAAGSLESILIFDFNFMIVTTSLLHTGTRILWNQTLSRGNGTIGGVMFPTSEERASAHSPPNFGAVDIILPVQTMYLRGIYKKKSTRNTQGSPMFARHPLAQMS